MNWLPLPALSVLILLGSCATEPVPVTYYLLAPPLEQTSSQAVQNNRSTLVIESVELATYLRQSGLVMQTGDNQLLVSRNHLWAEDMEQALPRALLQQLQQQSDDFAFYIRLADWIARTDYRLRLHIDSMQATDQGEVILAGRYQLIASADEANPLSANFFYRRSLEQDGHAHAVEQLQALIGELAATVLGSLQNLAEEAPQ